MNQVIELLRNYFNISIHPFRSQSSVADGVTNKIPSLAELISVSWIFIIIQAFYSIAGLNFSSMFLNDFYEGKEDTFPEMIIPGGEIETLNYSVLLTLASVVFFPLVGIFYVKLWHVIIRFFSDLFDKKDVQDKRIEFATNSLLASYIFYIFPIFGDLFQGLARLVYLFAGLRNNLGFTPVQSVVVLLSPVLIIALILILLFTTFTLILTSF